MELVELGSPAVQLVRIAFGGEHSSDLGREIRRHPGIESVLREHLLRLIERRHNGRR
jgi:hypothetical protein